MDKKDIFELATANPVFHLATVEGDKPHVRGMLMYSADENGIVFHTGKTKDLRMQLDANPHVEMCFYSPEKNIQVRISGTVELDENLALKNNIVADRPFLKPWVEKDSYDMLSVYRLKEGRATIWTMETNFASKDYIRI